MRLMTPARGIWVFVDKVVFEARGEGECAGW